MYVETMTPEEVFREYEADAKASYGFLRHQQMDFKRAVLKATKFPFQKIYEWKSPRGNDYLIRLYAKEKKYVKGNEIESDIDWFALIRNSKGINLYDATEFMTGHKAIISTGETIPSPPRIYTSHLFQRYKERFGLLPGYKDIRHQFLIRNNTDCFCSAIQPGVFQKSHGGDGEVLLMWRDGIFLGVAKQGYLQLNTYLSPKSILTPKQVEYIKKMVELHGELGPLYKEFEKQRDKNIEERTIHITL